MISDIETLDQIYDGTKMRNSFFYGIGIDTEGNITGLIGFSNVNLRKILAIFFVYLIFTKYLISLKPSYLNLNDSYIQSRINRLRGFDGPTQITLFNSEGAFCLENFPSSRIKPRSFFLCEIHKTGLIYRLLL